MKSFGKTPKWSSALRRIIKMHRRKKPAGHAPTTAQNPLKILFFDIETSPVLAWVWNSGKQYISHAQMKENSHFDVICICYKWAHEDKIHALDWGYHKQNSAGMIEEFSKVVKKADVIVGHNLDRFDVRKVNSRRLLDGKTPISWPTSEDTLKQVKKYFYFPSYKLDYLAKMLTGSGKDKMILEDWIDVVEKRNYKSFKRMLQYCKNDVLKLFLIWKKMAPFCKSKVHAGIITSGIRNACPRCGGIDYSCDGYRYTAAGRYQGYVCKTCSHKWRDSTRV